MLRASIREDQQSTGVSQLRGCDRQVLLGYVVVVGVMGLIANLSAHDFEVLAGRSGDEVEFHRTLWRMFTALRLGEWKHAVLHSFLAYGWVWFWFNGLISLPFRLVGLDSLAIILPRMQATVSLALLCWLLFETARLRVKAPAALVVSAVPLTMPGFWHAGTWFHPDMMAAMFLVGWLYYQARDQMRFGKEFWKGAACFGISVGVKFSGIMLLFLPLLTLLLALRWRVLTVREGVQRYAKAVALIVVCWLAVNPVYLHPRGMSRFFGFIEDTRVGFSWNPMWNVAGLNWLSWYREMTAVWFIHAAILFPVLGFGVWGALFEWRRRSRVPVVALAMIGFLVTYLYVTNTVAKPNYHFYLLPAFVFLPIMLIPVFETKRLWQVVLGTLLIGGQLSLQGGELLHTYWKLVVLEVDAGFQANRANMEALRQQLPIMLSGYRSVLVVSEPVAILADHALMVPSILADGTRTAVAARFGAFAPDVRRRILATLPTVVLFDKRPGGNEFTTQGRSSGEGRLYSAAVLAGRKTISDVEQGQPIVTDLGESLYYHREETPLTVIWIARSPVSVNHGDWRNWWRDFPPPARFKGPRA